MPLFMCRSCGCVENTALGEYWSATDPKIWPDGDALVPRCSECGPTKYRDGTATEYGKWHGQFEKRPAAGMLVDQDGHLWHDFEAVPAHYQILGIVSGVPDDCPDICPDCGSEICLDGCPSRLP